MRALAKEPGRENVEVISADLVARPQATQPATSSENLSMSAMHCSYSDELIVKAQR
jgi:predicted methyltransferase